MTHLEYLPLQLNYFGLQYKNKRQVSRWIVMHKSLKKELDRNGFNEGKDAVLAFKIQFFATDCQKLHQEITRYFVQYISILL